MNVTFLDLAKRNWENASIVFTHAAGDEGQLTLIAYHIQQAIELALKYTLEKNGIRYHKTHAIEDLISVAKENDVQTYLTEYIEEHAEMFSSWEQKCTYIVGFMVERNKVEKALHESKIYLTNLINSGL